MRWSNARKQLLLSLAVAVVFAAIVYVAAIVAMNVGIDYRLPHWMVRLISR